MGTAFTPAHDVQVSLRYSRFGLEVLVDYLESDGSKSSVVKSRGVDRYVTELWTECTQFMSPDAGAHAKEVSGTEQSVASLEQRTSSFISSFNRKDEKYIPIKGRVSQHIPSADSVLAKFKPILKRKIILSRHSGKTEEKTEQFIGMFFGAEVYRI